MRWNLLTLSLVYTATVIEGVSFPRPVELKSVNENVPPGTFITQVQATPQSAGSITYSLSGVYKADWFHINSSTGVITTAAQTLDLEVLSRDLLELTVVASKVGESTGTMTVFVTLVDINDNIPQFVNSPYEVGVSEATKVKDKVFEVTVTDKDRGGQNHYDLVSFNIVDGNTGGMFSIGGLTPNVGEITLEKPLDFEGPNRTYHLNVTATDDYGAGNQNWTIVTIKVTNEDDSTPTFLQYLYEVLVDVNTPKGLEVIKVHAVDAKAVSYAIYPASDPDETFGVNNLTGSVSVNKNLTRLTYYLIVTAQPQSSSSALLSAFSLVVVHVGNMPNRTFESSLVENEANTLVLDLKPVEHYFNVSNPVFEILQGDEGSKFVINQTTKELRVGAKGLDREQRAQYVLVVELRSNGINRGFAKIIVNVLDTNDNSPQFQSPASVSVREDEPPGSVIYTVIAADRDAGQNGTVIYEIVGGNEQGFFVLNNQSGALSLSRPLDYETAVQYVLNISASDLGEPRLQNFNDVTVNVIDVNDNSPVLQPRTVRVSLVEGTAPGSYVTQCNATDADSAANAKVTYHIVEGAANKFSINNVTGIITTTGQFDRESGTNEYVLVIKAQDKGQYPRADIGFVTISITNTNEHSPVVSPSSLIGGVYKETTHYSLVTTIKATDPDSDSNSAISYSIVSGDGVELFHVEPDTGHVRVACSLADKKGSKYTLEVSASDGGKTSNNNAIVEIFFLRDEDAIILTSGATPQGITSKRQEFLGMLETITGGKAFIKYLVKEDGKNSTLVTFHVVKNKEVMSGSEIISSFTANLELLDTTYKQWNIQGYQPPAPAAPEAQKRTGDEQLSAVVGAMICLGVIIGVGAIIMIIILIRRKQTGRSPFKKKRRTRVTFNDSPFYIYPDHSAMATNQVESAQEAQEVIVHIPAEDSSSLEGSDTSSQPDIVNFVNFGYAARMSAMNEKDPDELDDWEDEDIFFPPPPKGPPPAPPDSDSESDENNENAIADASEVYRNEFVKGEDNPAIYQLDVEGDGNGIVLSQSPTNSTTGSTLQLVNESPKLASPTRSILKRFPLNESTTDL